MWQNEVYSALKYEPPKITKRIASFFHSPKSQPNHAQPNQQPTTTRKKKKQK